MQINLPFNQGRFKPTQLLGSAVATMGLGITTALPVTAKTVENAVAHSTTETPTEVVTCYIRREVGNGAKVLADAVEQFAVDSSDKRTFEQSLAEAEKGCKEAMLDHQNMLDHQKTKAFVKAFVTIPSDPVNMPPVINFENPPFEVERYLTLPPKQTANKPVVQNLSLPPLKFDPPTSLSEQQQVTGTKKPKAILPQHLSAYYINLQKETTPVVEGYQLKNNEAAVVCYTESSRAKQLGIEGNLVPRKVLRITPEMAKLPETQLAKVAPLDKLLQDCYKAAPVGAVVLGTTVAVPAVIPKFINPYTNDGSEIKLLSENYQNTKTTLPHRKNP